MLIVSPVLWRRAPNWRRLHACRLDSGERFDGIEGNAFVLLRPYRTLCGRSSNLLGVVSGRERRCRVCARAARRIEREAG